MLPDLESVPLTPTVRGDVGGTGPERAEAVSRRGCALQVPTEAVGAILAIALGSAAGRRGAARTFIAAPVGSVES